MSEALEKQIEALPNEAQVELANYVDYLVSVYGGDSKKRPKTNEITATINRFLIENPNSFGEFAPVENAGAKVVRRLTENDAW